MVCRKICGRPFGYPLLSDSASYLDTGQTLVILGDGAVVVAAAVIVVQPLHNFLNGGGHGDGRTYSMGAVQSVVQILDVQVDLEAGLPAIIMGPLASITVEPARPPRMAR